MNLLFVCSGNTCRSALAEGLARKIAARRGIEDLNVSSAGTNAWDNAPAIEERHT
jgi:protein-tyrosine-phosphatase